MKTNNCPPPGNPQPHEIEWVGGPTFGGFMRQMMKDVGMSLEHVSDEMEKWRVPVHGKGTISRWENGHRTPNAAYLWAYFSVLRMGMTDRMRALELLSKSNR